MYSLEPEDHEALKTEKKSTLIQFIAELVQKPRPA